MAILIIEKAEKEDLIGQKFEIHEDTDSTLIGRQPSTGIALGDQRASREHARIFLRHGNWFLEDLGSRNGVFIASGGTSKWEKISKKQLSDSDVIQIGSTRMHFSSSQILDHLRDQEPTDAEKPAQKEKRNIPLTVSIIFWILLWAGIFLATKKLTFFILERLNQSF